MSMEHEHLTESNRHIANARRRVEEQKERLAAIPAAMRLNCYDSSSNAAVMENHREMILKELGRRK
jgi:hypothetical protein